MVTQNHAYKLLIFHAEYLDNMLTEKAYFSGR
jgi:hypothetical protein